MLSGRGGATDSHGHSECSGVTSSRLLTEKVEGDYIRPPGAVQTPNGEAPGLVPGVLHLPQVRFGVTLGEYDHAYECYAAGPSRVTTDDSVRRCVHCGTDADDETYTYCANCGSINCETHTRTERLEGTPVCTGCAVTDEFAFATKYVSDEANLAAFREEYAAMPLHRKAMENPPLVGGGLLATALAVLTLLVVTGVL